VGKRSRSSWADLPIGWASTLETVDAELKLSLHGGEPPMLHMDWVRDGDTVVFSHRVNLSAADYLINQLIKHRDLLAQMGGKGDPE
jgi:hypothetical protein